MEEVCQQGDGRPGFGCQRGTFLTILTLMDHLQPLQHTNRLPARCPPTVGKFIQYRCPEAGWRLGVQPLKARV
jgi:hypothetical protein